MVTLAPNGQVGRGGYDCGRPFFPLFNLETKKIGEIAMTCPKIITVIDDQLIDANNSV